MLQRDIEDSVSTNSSVKDGSVINLTLKSQILLRYSVIYILRLDLRHIDTYIHRVAEKTDKEGLVFSLRKFIFKWQGQFDRPGSFEFIIFSLLREATGLLLPSR